MQANYPRLRRHRLWRVVAASLRRRSASRRRRSSFCSSMILKSACWRCLCTNDNSFSIPWLIDFKRRNARSARFVMKLRTARWQRRNGGEPIAAELSRLSRSKMAAGINEQAAARKLFSPSAPRKRLACHAIRHALPPRPLSFHFVSAGMLWGGLQGWIIYIYMYTI